MTRVCIVFLLLASLALAACGGGGGGGGGTNPNTFTVVGRVLWIETGNATNPAATVRVGGGSGQTDTTDGSFSVSSARNATSLVVDFAPTGGTPISRTFAIPPVTSSTDVGDLYIGPATVTVKGKIVDSVTGAGISGASAKLAGIAATAGADGSFSLAGVAYSPTSLTVFLGLQGTASAGGYFSANFSPTSGAVSGVVDVGTIRLVPEGGGVPPPLPYNVSGVVSPVADGAGATVVVRSGAATIRTGTADSGGRFTFWLPAGSFEVEATKGAKKATGTVVLASPSDVKTVNLTFP